MSNILEVTQGTQYQSSDEELAYQITTTNWEASPTTSTYKVYDESVDEDVTSTVCPGSSSESNNVISLPVLKALTVDHSYRVEVKFVVGSNKWECHFKVKCVR